MKTQLSHKLAVIMLLALALALPAAATITRVAGCRGNSNGSSTTRSCSVSVSSGNWVVVLINEGNGESVPASSVTGTQGDTYTPRGNSGSLSTTYAADIWTGTASSTGTDTVTVTLSTAESYWDAVVEVLSGVSAIDTGSVQTWANGALTSNTFTYSTAVANEYVIAFGARNSGTTITVPTGWALLQGAGSYVGSDIGMTQATAATGLTVTITPASEAGIIAFEPPGGGGAPCVPTLALLGVGGSCG